jgi:alpha-1,2-mannosyltransferase
MRESGSRFKIGLLALGVFHLVWFCVAKYPETVAVKGVLYPDGTPVGGDFINLWSAAKLVLAGRLEDIYLVERFMSFQGTITNGADIGLRLWAYPPHSLLLAWPLGFVGFYPALALWTVLGLAALATGARRFGFDRIETAIILTSPATVLNLYYGQTGSFATGLLLLALSARTTRDPVPIAAAALLTIKPQAGFLLPLLWAFQRRWRAIALTSLAVIAFVLLAFALFGSNPWSDYLGDTLPILSALERDGSGPFMSMIPSVFMAMRIVAGDPSLALAAHMAFAVAVAAALVYRLWRVEDAERRAAMMLIATVLMTPYLHNYDLALLLCGALLISRRLEAGSRGGFLVLTAWALPQLVVLLNIAGMPISPLLILPLLFIA